MTLPELKLKLTEEQVSKMKLEQEKVMAYLQSDEHKEFIIRSISEELPILIAEYNKADYTSKEVIAIEEELKAAIKEDSVLDNISFEVITRLDSIFCRCWLVNYKGIAFILGDIGNSNWSYLCNPREALYKIAARDFGSEYVL